MVKTHLLKIRGHGVRLCSKVTLEHKLEMQKMHDEVEKIRIEKNKRR